MLRAVEFLLNVNQGFRVDLGERVVVVGGGNVAFDAARTALRAAAGGPRRPTTDGARDQAGVGTPDDARRAMTTTLDVARAARREGVLDVTVIALESPDEIPADPEEIEEAEAEGITILLPPRAAPLRRRRRAPDRARDDRRGVGVRRRGPVRPDLRRRHRGRCCPADTVILAVGQTADLDLPRRRSTLERTRGGGVQIDPATLRTSHPRIWAGGDVAKGPRNLIDAIADGQRAAASIHAASARRAPTPTGRRHRGRRPGRAAPRPGFRRLSTGYDAIARRPIPATPTDRRIGFAEVEIGYDAAGRLARVAALPALLRQHHARPGAVHPVRPLRRRLPARTASRSSAPTTWSSGTEAQSVLLLDEDLCIRCGLCVNRCPPGALSMVHAQEVGHD